MKINKIYELTLFNNREDKKLISKLERDNRWWRSAMGSDGRICYRKYQSIPIEDSVTLDSLLREDKTE